MCNIYLLKLMCSVTQNSYLSTYCWIIKCRCQGPADISYCGLKMPETFLIHTSLEQKEITPKVLKARNINSNNILKVQIFDQNAFLINCCLAGKPNLTNHISILVIFFFPKTSHEVSLLIYYRVCVEIARDVLYQLVIKRKIPILVKARNINFM